VLRIARSARIAICGQAPGTRVHASGKPFTDPSGDRLRAWMGVDEATFYDQARVAIVPMGFCFPGLDAKGGDLPPRRECPAAWRERVFDQLPRLRLILLVGSYAIKWHLGELARASLSETVRCWRDYETVPLAPGSAQHVRAFPMPHPSWRNNAWLKKNAWFEAELLPELRGAVAGELNLS
jgi:uracil-DNA glycosylase